jgi:hypothetical protein
MIPYQTRVDVYSFQSWAHKLFLSTVNIVESWGLNFCLEMEESKATRS